MIRSSIYFLFFVCTSTIIWGQDIWQASTDDTSPEIVIKGSSTLHEWSAKAEIVTDYPSSLQFDSDKSLDIDGFEFKVAVESLDGGRGSAMNDKIYKALDATHHPHIHFRQTEPISLPNVSSSWKAVSDVTGELSMAGKTLPVTISLSVHRTADELIFSGSKALKMSDYGIAPPSAMFGQIVTEDDIVVHYTFYYKKQ